MEDALPIAGHEEAKEQHSSLVEPALKDERGDQLENLALNRVPIEQEHAL